MAEAPVLGIDLGTTNSVVAVADADGVRVLRTAEGDALIPSVVSFHPGGDVLAGVAAKERRVLDASSTVYSVKRLIGRPFSSVEVKQASRRFPFALEEGPNGSVLVQARDEQYSLSEISAFVLRHVRKTAEAALGVECTRAVVTVPANFNELQRTATKTAGTVAGLDVLRIINEPTAAALAYGYGKASNERIAIYDLGGGTFDLTILQLADDVFEVLATAGDTFLGGDDIDHLIGDDMATDVLEQCHVDMRNDPDGYERLRNAAEWAKCQLSEHEDVTVRVEEVGFGQGGAPINLDYTLTRDRFEQLSRAIVTRTFDVCEEAMSVAGIRPTQIDKVILVGGSTRIPLVKEMVEEYFGQPPLMDIDPDMVVAHGAALQGWALGQPARASIGKVRLRKISVESLQPLGEEAEEEVTEKKKLPPLPPVEDMPTQVRTRDEIAGLVDESGPHSLESLMPEAQTNPVPPPIPDGAFDISMSPPPAPPVPASDDEATRVAPPPLLLDVTPLSLGVETVGGYCEHIIKRNSAIPTEESKVFTTARDNQESVEVRICQGESRSIDQNQPLGKIALSGLRPGTRGTVRITVAFAIDVNGTLQVRAIDAETGQEQEVAIRLIGEVAQDDIEGLVARHEEKFGD